MYYKVSDKEENIYRFDNCGRLVLMEESNGTFVYIEYNDKNGRINCVITSKGQEAIYSYNENGFISKITAANDSDKSYSYEYQYENNKLIKVMFVGTNGDKIEYKYVYNNDNRGNKIEEKRMMHRRQKNVCVIIALSLVILSCIFAGTSKSVYAKTKNGNHYSERT